LDRLQDYKAALDPQSVKISNGQATADIIVDGAFRKQYVFSIAWKPGHEADWSWLEADEIWLQTEFNAEHAGLEPAQLLELVGAAVMGYAREQAQGRPREPMSQ
jgi:hypothetical protein